MDAQAADVVVVGAGINGLSTAWNLARLRAGRVVLLDRFRAGHDRGSSHGESRITRTSYHDARFAALAMEVARDDWPRLEREAGLRLVHPAPGLFFGPADGQIPAYEASAAASGAPVDAIDAHEARRRFPQFRFDDSPRVLVDRSAGVLAAADTMRALRRLVEAAGVEVREDTPVEAIESLRRHVGVRTDRGVLATGRVVVTAGAWVSRLLPELAPRFAVERQTVCWFEGDGDPASFRAPRFPVWVWLGREEHDHFYGLPEFGRPGIKAARHVTGGGSDDPDLPSGPSPPPGVVEQVMTLLRRELASPPRRLLAWERCLYTNTASQDFVLGALPRDPRIVVGAACSGHAFKFGPLTGRVLAEIATGAAATSSPAFERSRAAFAP